MTKWFFWGSACILIALTCLILYGTHTTAGKEVISGYLDFSFSEFEVTLSRGSGKDIYAWKGKSFRDPEIIQRLKKILAKEFQGLSSEFFNGSTLIFSVDLRQGEKKNPHCGILGIFKRNDLLFFTVYPRTGLEIPHQTYFLMGDLKVFFQNLLENDFARDLPLLSSEQQLFRDRLDAIKNSP